MLTIVEHLIIECYSNQQKKGIHSISLHSPSLILLLSAGGAPMWANLMQSLSSDL